MVGGSRRETANVSLSHVLFVGTPSTYLISTYTLVFMPTGMPGIQLKALEMNNIFNFNHGIKWIFTADFVLLVIMSQLSGDAPDSDFVEYGKSVPSEFLKFCRTEILQPTQHFDNLHWC